jgi:hypothetical protein
MIVLAKNDQLEISQCEPKDLVNVDLMKEIEFLVVYSYFQPDGEQGPEEEIFLTKSDVKLFHEAFSKLVATI